MYKKKINFLLTSLMLLLFLFNIYPIYGQEDYNSLEKEQEIFITDKENINWLSNYEEITEEDLEKILINYCIVSATANNNSGNLYITLKNNENPLDIKEYKITKASSQLISYIKIQNIDYQSIIFSETNETENNKATNNNMGVFEISVVSILIGVLLIMLVSQNRKEKSPVAINPINGTNDKTNENIPTIKFDDVEGIEELKTDIIQLVDCLKNPQKYQDIGARIPKGVILYGPPGTGKTLIAKAIAGEAGVPFFSMVGSDFVEKYVGVGAQRVRELYKKARKAAPCIVFIDEVDAVAGQRGRDNNTEADQTINALLAELDGFKASESVITICATNRLDMLDSAFKRAGRFDLKLAVGLPDKKSRKNILLIHSKNKKLHNEIDLDVLANKTVGFSGAELEALLNESALIAVRKNKKEIDYNDIDDAFFKLVMQGNKKRRDKITEVNKVVAWHEAGHTLATKLLTDDNVPSVTIVGSSSGAGGVTFRTPKEDNILHSRKYLESLVQIMYAGRAAEELYFGNTDSITTGASQDIKQASSIIKEYLGIYGMGNIGMLDVSQFRQDYVDIIEEASDMSKILYESVLKLLENNLEVLNKLALNLLEKETLDEKEIDRIIYKNNT